MKRSIVSHLFILVCSLIASVQPLFAQDDSSGIAVLVAVPEVVNVTNLAAGHEKELRVGDRIRVDVKNLGDLIAQQKSDTAHLFLYLDGVPMTDMKASYYDLSDNGVFFHLKREGGTDPWDVFYQSPLIWQKEVTVSVGYYNESAIPSSQKCELVIIRKGYFWVAILLIVAIMALLVYAIKRGMTKDDSILPLAQRPYSLSRSQLTFWTVIISVSYIFIALVTGELAPLTTSTLILLGISGVTSAAAVTIDNNDKLNDNSRQQDNYSSDGFINDVLSDIHGISVHRFQMLVFNAILGIFFIKQVFTTLQMPDFDNNLLALMGLSNVTYAGLKVNENKGADIVNPQITDTTSSADIPPVG